MPLGGKCQYGLDSYTPMEPGGGGVRDARVGAAKDAATTDSGRPGGSSGGSGSRTSSVSGLLGALGVGLLYTAGLLMVVVRAPISLVRWATQRGRPESQALISEKGAASPAAVGFV